MINPIFYTQKNLQVGIPPLNCETITERSGVTGLGGCLHSLMKLNYTASAVLNEKYTDASFEILNN